VIAKLIALVLPLGLDSFAVAAALGMIGTSPATRLRISVLFTAFESGMPLIGLALGAPLGHAIGKTADYIAIGVLLTLGLYTLAASDEHEQQKLAQLSEPRGLGALLLGLSISLDEVLPATSAASIWRRLGITTMIGRNDIRSETFTTKDASEVVGFARAHSCQSAKADCSASHAGRGGSP
jgi:putative Mn2+ efflux pump MntP